MTDGSIDDAGHPPGSVGGHGLNDGAPQPTLHAGHTRTLECRTVATGRLQQRYHIRDLEPIGGEPVAGEAPSLLREDSEPHPSEMLLSAIGACLSISIQANAVARGIPIRRLEVLSRGDIDPSALWGTGGGRVKPLGFRAIEIEVHIDADVAPEALKSLVDYAVLWSPVANTVHDPVDLHVAIVKSERRDGPDASTGAAQAGRPSRSGAG